MNNRKGFTLIELLAVIAILAILVIIALPNVLSMYKKAQKEMFLTEAKKVYSEAEKKYLLNSISGKTAKVINSENSSKLDMTGKKLQYCIILNNSGKVAEMKVSNGKWVASLDENEKLEDLTIDDLEEGNLDDYECGEPATSESCFTYNINEETYGTTMVTIEDINKCKTYLSAKYADAPEDAITSVCKGENYEDEGVLIFYFVVDGTIPSSDYSTAGLSVKKEVIEKVEVIDVNKCKNYLSQISSGSTEEELKIICETNASVNGKTLSDAVIEGYISNLEYSKAGLNVVSRPLSTSVTITGYDTNCGTDVVIPSKINGYKVTAIDNHAFESCLRGESMVTPDNEYRLLNYNFNDNYIIKKMEYCIRNQLTSVVLPDSLVSIGRYSFSSNNLKSITIPSSVRYIDDEAFSYNDITSVTYEGSKSNIEFGYCPFYGNYNYDKRNEFCKLR